LIAAGEICYKDTVWKLLLVQFKSSCWYSLKPLLVLFESCCCFSSAFDTVLEGILPCRGQSSTLRCCCSMKEVVFFENRLALLLQRFAFAIL
jgi:hypothetical protein